MGRRWPVASCRKLRGVTLLELAVALAILGAALAVAGLGVRSLELPRAARIAGDIELARARAASTGVVTTVSINGRSVRFAPDGSATGGPIVLDSLVFFVDPITGELRSAAR